MRSGPRLTLLLGLLAGVPALAGGLDQLLGRDEPALLPAARAFALRVVHDTSGAPALQWDIAPGYYLYRTRVRVESETPAVGVTAALPGGEFTQDDALGRVEIYRDRVLIPLTLTPPGTSATLLVRYQGCADGRACYAPAEYRLSTGGP